MGYNIGLLYDLQGDSLHIRNVDSLNTKAPPVRSSIREFSHASAARMRRYLRKCVAEYTTLCTLTYPGIYPTDGRVAKNHLRVFLQRWKRYCKSEDFSAFWFLEFQNRGAPHFHIFCTHQTDKNWIADAWFAAVGSNDEKHRCAGTRIEAIRSGRRGTCAYASKYAAKFEQKNVPDSYKDCGRFWGIHGVKYTVEASIFIKASKKLSEHHIAFRKTLNKVLEGAKIKKIHPRYSIFYLPNEAMAKKVEREMMNAGLKMLLADEALIDFSTLGHLEE